jgi:hypothetical protein
MNKKDYKRIFYKLEPSEDFERRIAMKINSKGKKSGYKPMAIIAASLVLVLGVGVLKYHIDNTELSSQTPPITETKKPVVSYNPVVIPKIELPENAGVAARMMPLIVYKGRIYLQSDAQIAPESIKTIIGEKIGRTKSGITEWSKQEDYATEFASTVGEMDVYTIKGYDSSFRIMTYEKYDNLEIAGVFECLNGIELKNGMDLFSKLDLNENLQSIAWESYDSWNNGKQEIKNIQKDEIFSAFLTALYNAEPLAEEKLGAAAIDNAEQNQKFLMLQLKDSTVVRLRLLKDGYVMYNNLQVYFKVGAAEFNTLWNSLN